MYFKCIIYWSYTKTIETDVHNLILYTLAEEIENNVLDSVIDA